MGNGIRTICRAARVGLLVIGSAGAADARLPPPRETLPRGPHAVGFKTSWQLDYSRRYDTTFGDGATYAPGKAPRPILVNLWYPAGEAADARRMAHRDYLDIRSSDPRLARFAAELAGYNRGVIAAEVMGKSPADLTDREAALLDRFLDTPTACVRDAAPLPGPFPLVIYHAGAGSSFEDNSSLCEFLSSHGFVVLGSAFQEGRGGSFNTDNREGSARDLDFLIAHAGQLPNVDWRHIGLIGHSAGAHAALIYGSRANAAVDAVVSLDTTQDYHGLSDPAWQFPAEVLRNEADFTCPLLMVAGPGAFFELADALRHAQRYYLTIPDMDHNDYIAQGHVRREQLDRLREGDDPMGAATDRARGETDRERARAGYRALCVYVLRFLEAKLKGDAAGEDFLAERYRDTEFGDGAPHVEYVPPGDSGPDPYREGGALPPTPRQLRPFLRAQGSEKTIAVLRRFRGQAASHPIFSRDYQLILVGDLLLEGRAGDAIALRDYYRESGLDCGEAFMELGKGWRDAGYPRMAAMYYRRVLLLEPDNREAAAELGELGEGP